MGLRSAYPPDLVGRKLELSAARSALGEARGGVLLAGEPGVGKTSLARSLMAELGERADTVTLWLVASAHEPGIPFGAFAPFVPDIGGEPGRQPDPLFLFQTLRRALLERANGLQLVIGVDDAHRLDGHSAALLFQLVGAREARVLLAVRTGTAAPAAIRALWKEEQVSRIDIEPLGREDAEELMRRLLSLPDDAADPHSALSGQPLIGGDLAEALWRVSRGNPLYLRELVRAGRRSGHIVPRDGVWHLNGDITVGPRLTELLQERLDGLSLEELSTLEAVAYADPLPLRVLARLAPSKHISSLQRAGLLTVERARGEQVVRAGHPLHAEAVRAAIPANRAAELGLLLAEAFEADGRMATELLRIVSWQLDGGRDPGPEILLRASLRAAERQDWALSIRLAEAAIAAGGGADAMFALADARRAVGDFGGALDALGEQEGRGDDQVARVAALRAIVVFMGQDQFELADAALARARLRITDPSHDLWLQAVRAGLLCFAGRPLDAVREAEPLLGRPELSRRAQHTARASLALGLALTGRGERALALLAGHADVDFPDAGGWIASAWMTTARALALGYSGRGKELQSLSQGSYKMAVQLNNCHLQGEAAMLIGWSAVLRGKLAAATRRFREATTALGDGYSIFSRAMALIELGEVLALSGDPAAAEAALEDARRWAEGSAWLAPRWKVASAWLVAAQGSLSQALQLIDEAVALAREGGQTAFEIVALHAAVRLGSAAPAARLAELQMTAPGELLDVVTAHAGAQAISVGSGDALDQVTERYADMGLHLFAAEAGAQACRAHRLAGEHRRATASAARAHFLLGVGHNTPRPLALAVAMTPPELTKRENEVAMLAARGMSSQAIASRLCLSVRTVETHLARVYYKLGIGGRSELSGALLPREEEAG